MRTDSSRLDHVSDGESLDRLIFWTAARTVRASDELDMTTALFISPTKRYC